MTTHSSLPISFVKMHGTGNDLPVIEDFDDRYDLSVDAVRHITDRNFGIGGDGLIRIVRDENSRYFMDFRNPDGSIPQMCGNGVRICGKWLGDRGYVDDEFELATRGGIKKLKLHRGDDGLVHSVTVDMGPVGGEVRDVSIPVDGLSYSATLVPMPNPHAVLFVEDVDASPVADLGSKIENLPMFPEGTNVEFVDERDGSLRQRTWERGAGETLACGSGACAVAVASFLHGLHQGEVLIHLRGGDLRFEWSPGKSIIMTGPAVTVFEGGFDGAAFGVTIK